MRLPDLLGVCCLTVLAPLSASAAVDPPDGSPKFLILPYTDDQVQISEGWYYQSGDFDWTCGKRLEGEWRHCGIDFSNDGASFEVGAAASGRACKHADHNELGNYVVVQHEHRAPSGQRFQTRYAHLASMWQGEQCKTVERGDPLGLAGATGDAAIGIHLHFDVFFGAYTNQNLRENRVDPYDIAGGLIRRGEAPTNEYYPSSAAFEACGKNHLWITCPPAQSPPVACSNVIQPPQPVPEGFGVPYNVLSQEHELLVRASCDANGATIRLGNGSEQQYIYESGYVWGEVEEEWVPISYSGARRKAVWYVGEASTTLPPEMEQSDGSTHFVAYICTWTGSPPFGGGWKCGCREDRPCTESGLWQLQEFRRQ